MLISRMFAGSVAQALLVLVAVGVPAQEAFEVTQEALDRVLEQIVPAVEQELGLELEVQARIAKRSEIARVLREENLVLMEAQLGDAEAADTSARMFGWTASENLLAKYAFEKREVLVNPQVFETSAVLYDDDAINSEEFLRAVLVHELVHAADDARYSFSTVLQGLDNAPAISAYSAVFEGHAQFVARAICEAHGWQVGFELFTGMIGYLPEELLEDLDTLTALTLRASASDARTSYHSGERFIAALYTSGGEEAVARAFSAPPATLESVLNPEWFLDPASRPASGFDMDAGLDRFRGLNRREGWLNIRNSILKPQMEASMVGLPQAVIDRLLASVVSGRSETLTLGGGEQMVMAAVYEVTPGPAAEEFVEVLQELSLLRDSSLEGGPQELLVAEYTQIDRGGLRGFMARKVIPYMGLEVPVLTGVLHSGALVCAVTYSNLPWGHEQALLDMRQVLAVARGEALPWGVESFEASGLPLGWEVTETASTSNTAAWTLAEDPEAPEGERVLRVAATNAGHTFNLLLDGAQRTADLSVRVQLRADSGEEDQGGGVCWRVLDADNYYVTRWNPLEDNLRVYKVEGGVRHELQSADVHADPATWHELEASMEGTHISVRFDGAELLALDDETFSAPAGGRVGLWTKADASVSFDAFSVR